MRYLIFMGVIMVLPVTGSAFYCGNNLISKGDHVLEVVEHCGEPQYREEYVVRKSVLLRHHHLLPYYSDIKPVTVREWTYNFGRRKFMRKIRFEDGIVKRIETLRRGP